MSDMPGSGPASWVAAMLDRTRAKGQILEAQLEAWLRGEDLPPVGYAEPPYSWLLLGVVASDDEAEAARAIATPLARIIHRCFEERTSAEVCPRFLHDVLMLASGLRQGTELFSSLYSAYLQTEGDSTTIDHTIVSDIHAAIMSNQIDATMAAHWIALMSRSIGSGNLVDAVVAFDGLRLMPKSKTSREPDTSLIGLALGQIAEPMSGLPFGRDRFRVLVSRLVGTNPSVPWGQILIEEADRCNWSRWGLESLPTPLFVLPQRDRAYVWEPMYYAVEAIGVGSSINIMCNGAIVLTAIDPKQIDVIEPVANQLDDARLSAPWRTNQAMVGVASDALTSIEQRLRLEQQIVHAEKLVLNRGRFLNETGTVSMPLVSY